MAKARAEVELGSGLVGSELGRRIAARSQEGEDTTIARSKLKCERTWPGCGHTVWIGVRVRSTPRVGTSVGFVLKDRARGRGGTSDHSMRADGNLFVGPSIGLLPA